MRMNVNQPYCGDHFAIHTYFESLCHAPKTNILCQSYFSQKSNTQNSHESVIRRQITSQNMGKTLIDVSPKKLYGWPIDT